MINKQEHRHCTPEQLYLKMLEIGSECISCGTNLKKIKSELSNCGLISADEDDTTLKILFENSFHDDQYNHLSKYCKCPYPNSNYNCTDKEARKQYDEQTEKSDKYNHYDNCTWFLSQEALMNLLRLKEADKNRKTTKRTFWISIASLGTALLILISNLTRPKFSKVFNTTEYKQLKSELSTSMSNINSSLAQAYQLDSVHLVNDSLRISNLVEKTNLEEIKETLKSLNWKLMQIKREIKNE